MTPVDVSHGSRSGVPRRDFLGLAMAAPLAKGPDSAKTLPSVAFGKHRISRLVAGANPIGGYSHLTRRVSDLMVQYFTPERTVDYLVHCWEEGITVFESHYDEKVRAALTAARDRGAKLDWICLGKPSENLKDILALKPIGIAHHGNVTDTQFLNGKEQTVRDYVKQVKDAGVMAGVSAHNPENLWKIEEAGWETDFYMSCFFRVTRPREEIRAKLGDVPLGEPFFEGDPDRMTGRIQQIKKPCLGFKILGAGRLVNGPDTVDKAFRYAFSRIKKTDAVIVGMWPILRDEIAENAALTRKYGVA